MAHAIPVFIELSCGNEAYGFGFILMLWSSILLCLQNTFKLSTSVYSERITKKINREFVLVRDLLDCTLWFLKCFVERSFGVMKERERELGVGSL